MTQTMDIKLLEDRVEALRLRLGQLKGSERIMLQAHGLEAQIARAVAEAPGIEADIQAYKEELQELVATRDKIVNESLEAFAERMQAALPHGTPRVSIVDEKIEIGWEIDGCLRPFKALSGGERVSFDIALAHAFEAGLIIKEAAELDCERLESALDKLRKITAQVILTTWAAPKKVPEGWTLCAL